MPKPAMAPMSLQQLDDFRAKLRANAESLLIDARLLADAKRYPRVFTLCVLATEELARLSVVWFIRKTVAQGGGPDWPHLTKILYNHQAKLKISMELERGVGSILASEFATPSQLERMSLFAKVLCDKAASILDVGKQSGLYVCLTKAGDAASPENSIDETTAMELLAIAESSLKTYQMLDEAAGKVIGGRFSHSFGGI